jgi:hypothetical protein
LGSERDDAHVLDALPFDATTDLSGEEPIEVASPAHPVILLIIVERLFDRLEIEGSPHRRMPEGRHLGEDGLL